MRSAAFRGNGFALAKGNELLYRFMQIEAFNRENRSQKAVNGFAQGVAIQLFGRLADTATAAGSLFRRFMRFGNPTLCSSDSGAFCAETVR